MPMKANLCTDRFLLNIFYETIYNAHKIIESALEIWKHVGVIKFRTTVQLFFILVGMQNKLEKKSAIVLSNIILNTVFH